MPPKSLRAYQSIRYLVCFALEQYQLPVDLLPCRFQRVALVPAQLLDRLLDLFLVLQHRAEHLFEARFALLDAGKEWSTLGCV
jgi:hypothetical protein